MRFFITLIVLTLLTGSLPAFERGEDLRVQRFLSAKVQSKNVAQIDKVIRRIFLNKKLYKCVDSRTDVPWYVIACLHNMESGGSFRHHLHEGSPLYGRTRWVPKGRPKTGTAPFTWVESAQDALSYDKMGEKRWAFLFDTLWAVEGYNGTGYWRYHRSTPSPYLYAKTTIEKPGKYVSDGKWSSTARSKQIGIVAIWKRMQDLGMLNFNVLK
jgi:lysozyme family protein